jgi:hypothetical protein
LLCTVQMRQRPLDGLWVACNKGGAAGAPVV